MNDPVLTVYLKFPDDSEWIDVSDLVQRNGRKKNEYAFGSDHKYRADTFSCQLKYSESIAAKFLSANEDIECRVLNGAEAVITGIVPPTYSQDIHEIADPISIEVEDNAYKLDIDIAESYSYEDYYVFNRSDPGHSIVHQRLYACGLTADDIDVDFDITTVIPYFCRETGEETELETINTLLFENRHVGDFTGEGKFTIRPWTFTDPSSSFEFNETNIGRDRIIIRKKARSYDSIIVKWATLDTQEDALVYRENLPIDSEGNFTGKLLLSGGRFPIDGAIKPTWQNFRTSWLNTEDESDDVAIIKVDSPYVDHTAENDIVIETEVMEHKRARVVFLNEGAESQRLYRFDIRGDVLYRAIINETCSELSSGIHKKPLTITTKNIFGSSLADSLAIALKNDLKYGDKEYE